MLLEIVKFVVLMFLHTLLIYEESVWGSTQKYNAAESVGR
jgi:hypothetical protein